MPVIRIDEEVMRELQRKAIDMNLVFGQPNQVLRRVLGLDDKSQGHSEKGVQQMTTVRRVTGKSLLRQHPEIPQEMRPYSDRDGIFYDWPKEFPAVLFDSGGYVIYRSEQDMLDSERYIRLYPDTSKISVRDGISSLPTYEECDHDH